MHKSVSVLSLALSSGLVATAASAWAPPANDPAWQPSVFSHRCADVQLASTQYRVHCAADGQVAALQGPVDAWLGERLGATLAWEHRGTLAGPRGAPVVKVWTLRDMVIVEDVTCPTCERAMGFVWLLRPERAPDALLRTVQSAAGVSAAAPLRTVQAWRDVRP